MTEARSRPRARRRIRRRCGIRLVCRPRLWRGIAIRSSRFRGFNAPRYLDGLRLPGRSTTTTALKIEAYGLERLEVLKGPSSALYGQTPGGLINMISKRPTGDTSA